MTPGGTIEPPPQPARPINSGSQWGVALRRNRFVQWPGQFGDYRLAAGVGIVLGAYLAFAIGFYWMMQPSVAANSGIAAYRPPPKTVVHHASSPWVPPPASEARPTAQPEPDFAQIEPTAETKKQTKRQERATARQTRPVRQQPNPFSAYGSSRSAGSRPWF